MRMVKTTWKKNKVERTSLPNINAYYSWNNQDCMISVEEETLDHWSRIENPDTVPEKYV